MRGAAPALAAVTGQPWSDYPGFLLAWLDAWCSQHPGGIRHGPGWWRQALEVADEAERVILTGELAALTGVLEEISP